VTALPPPSVSGPDAATVFHEQPQSLGRGARSVKPDKSQRAPVLLRSQIADGGGRDARTTSAAGYMEMIEQTGTPGERCGPGDCGASVQAMSQGVLWVAWPVAGRCPCVSNPLPPRAAVRFANGLVVPGARHALRGAVRVLRRLWVS
jgi:hypothetical protein